LFLCKTRGQLVFIFVHVDDLVFGGQSVDWVKNLLREKLSLAQTLILLNLLVAIY
jgi:hypothetical protein